MSFYLELSGVILHRLGLVRLDSQDVNSASNIHPKKRLEMFTSADVVSGNGVEVKHY